VGDKVGGFDGAFVGRAVGADVVGRNVGAADGANVG
jgi:hypothetical protein